MSMRNRFSALVLLLGLMVGLPACKSIKVDCDKMCSKTFRECMSEVMLSAKKVTPKELEAIQKVNGLKKMQQDGYTHCMADCKKKKGFGSDAGKINTCLDKKSCKDYAECIKEHLK